MNLPVPTVVTRRENRASLVTNSGRSEPISQPTKVAQSGFLHPNENNLVEETQAIVQTLTKKSWYERFKNFLRSVSTFTGLTKIPNFSTSKRSIMYHFVKKERRVGKGELWMVLLLVTGLAFKNIKELRGLTSNNWFRECRYKCPMASSFCTYKAANRIYNIKKLQVFIKVASATSTPVVTSEPAWLTKVSGAVNRTNRPSAC
jgi:hypothetical protein